MSVATPLPPAVAELQSILAHDFTHSRYLLEALRMPGAGFGNLYAQSSHDGNKRLAQLGDAILRMIVLDDWYANGAGRGVASEQIATVVSAAYLSEFAPRINLHECVLVNMSQGNELSKNMLAKTVQALVGALWLDSDRNLVETRRVLEATQFWNMGQPALQANASRNS